MTWQKVGVLSDFADNGLSRAEVQGTEILIIRMGENLSATQLRCTHEDDDLSKGTLEDGKIVCSYHYATYDPSTGEVLSQPQDSGEATRLKTYAIKLVNGEVLVDL